MLLFFKILLLKFDYKCNLLRKKLFQEGACANKDQEDYPQSYKS